MNFTIVWLKNFVFICNFYSAHALPATYFYTTILLPSCTNLREFVQDDRRNIVFSAHSNKCLSRLMSLYDIELFCVYCFLLLYIVCVCNLCCTCYLNILNRIVFSILLVCYKIISILLDICGQNYRLLDNLV